MAPSWICDACGAAHQGLKGTPPYVEIRVAKATREDAYGCCNAKCAMKILGKLRGKEKD